MEPTKENLYQEGVQNVMKSVILYSMTFRRIAGDLIEMYSGNVIRPYDYTVLFANFYDRTNQLVEAISNTMADVIRRTTTQDAVRSKTTNALKRELLDDSFYDLNDNLRRFKLLMNDLGIAIEAKTTENAFNATVLTAGTIGAVLSGTRKMSYLDGMAMAAAVTKNHQNSLQMDLMRRQKIEAALAAMVTTTSLLNDLTIKLMDQYSSLVYGGHINLEIRDQHLYESNEEVNGIVNACNQIAFYAKEIYEKAIFYSENMQTRQNQSQKNIWIILLIISIFMIIGSCVVGINGGIAITFWGVVFAIFSIFMLLRTPSVSIVSDVSKINDEIKNIVQGLITRNHYLENISLKYMK